MRTVLVLLVVCAVHGSAAAQVLKPGQNPLPPADVFQILEHRGMPPPDADVFRARPGTYVPDRRSFPPFGVGVPIYLDGVSDPADGQGAAPQTIVVAIPVPMVANAAPAEPPPAPARPAAPPGPPKTFYVIPGCYAGDTRPEPDQLPSGCDVQRLRVRPPR
jgi:hypothetical protein